jgi:hypothetical protein
MANIGGGTGWHTMNNLQNEKMLERGKLNVSII